MMDDLVMYEQLVDICVCVCACERAGVHACKGGCGCGCRWVKERVFVEINI